MGSKEFSNSVLGPGKGLVALTSEKSEAGEEEWREGCSPPGAAGP